MQKHNNLCQKILITRFCIKVLFNRSASEMHNQFLEIQIYILTFPEISRMVMKILVLYKSCMFIFILFHQVVQVCIFILHTHVFIQKYKVFETKQKCITVLK